MNETVQEIYDNTLMNEFRTHMNEQTRKHMGQNNGASETLPGGDVDIGWVGG